MYTKIVQSYDPVTKCKFKCGKEEKNFKKVSFLISWLYLYLGIHFLLIYFITKYSFSYN